MGNGWLEAGGGEHESVACLDPEAGPLDGGAGVAGGVAAAGDLGPEAAVVGELEEDALGWQFGMTCS
jgi:hypothetical protein